MSRSEKNIQKEFIDLLNEKYHPGESRYGAKQRAKEEYFKTHGSLKGHIFSRAEGIYSYETKCTYKQIIVCFARWLKEKKNINRYKNFKKEDAIEYLQMRRDQSKSSYTLAKEMCAINKVLNLNLTKKECYLPKCSYKEIKRSRNSINTNLDFPNDYYQTLFAKACGCRRSSVTKVKISDFTIANDRYVAVHLIEKSGKPRIAPILNKYKDELTKFLDSTDWGNVEIFKSYKTRIDNHQFRAQYVKRLIIQLEEEKKYGLPYFEGDITIEYKFNHRDLYTGKKVCKILKPYLGHDREIIAIASAAIGHNRLDVIKNNYWYIREGDL